MCGNGFKLAWRPADMRNRIKRDLPAVERGRVSANLRGKGMRAFMARRGEKKNDVPDNSERDEIRSHDDRKTRTPARNPQALIQQSRNDSRKFRLLPSSFAVQTCMLDSAKRSHRRKSFNADRRSVELRALCNDSPRTPPGPEGSNGSGSASCAADHPKFLLSLPARANSGDENRIE
jgi:hypothetical protein